MSCARAPASCSATLRVQPGDRIGLAGRNGAGKTTATTRVLAGVGQPYARQVTRASEPGYLPQDPREGDLPVIARDRVLSARHLDGLLAEMTKTQAAARERTLHASPAGKLLPERPGTRRRQRPVRRRQRLAA